MRQRMTLTTLFVLGMLITTTLSQFAPAQTYKVIHPFTWAIQPSGALVQDASGNLYGTTIGDLTNGYGVVYKLSSNSDGSWSTTILHAFNKTDGAYPSAGLILDAAGNLYGTTRGGGNTACQTYGPSGCGVVFQVAPASGGTWKYSVLHKFTGPDGMYPFGELVLDKSGNLYGTTELGGSAKGPGGGTVFELWPTDEGTWTLRTIHAFSSNPNDSSLPMGPLAIDSAGNLYGATANIPGSVFKLAPQQDGSWKGSLIYTFSGTGSPEGAEPGGGIVIDRAGNLYGTGSVGFIGACILLDPNTGCGFVFKLSENADGTWRESVLHKFTGGPDGGGPLAAVTLDEVGNVYGTTSEGGDLGACAGYGCGVVYKLVLERDGTWSETVLHSFQGYGIAPRAPVLLDPNGIMYGTTEFGVMDSHGFDHGLVFEITP